MAKYIFKKLTREQTTAFQKLLFFWQYIRNNNQQPNDPALLDQINYVVELQNNSAEYQAKVIRGEA